MTLALTAKHKLYFVDGSVLRPPASDLLFSSWLRCNSMVISWILNSVSKEIADSLLYFSTAYEVWTDLQTRFSEANGPRIFQLKQQISSLCQGSLDVNGYYTKLKSLWDELQDYVPLPSCTCGALRTIQTQREQDRVLQFLIGLNDSFSSACAQLLLVEPLPSLAKVFSLILQEERQRQISVSLPASAVPETPPFHPLPSDSSFPSMVATTQRRSRPVCTYCNIPGHTREKCFKLHGYPPGYKPKPIRPNFSPNTPQAYSFQSVSHPSPNFPKPTFAAASSTTDSPLAFTPTQYNQLLTLIQQSSAAGSSSSAPSVTTTTPSIASFSGMSPRSLPRSCWVLDTGATHHVCISSDLFVSSVPSDSMVVFPNDSSDFVSTVGSVCISESFLLLNVLCVPSFMFNLLSISALTRDSPFFANFSSSHCLLQDRASATTIGIARRYGDLYVLDSQNLFSHVNVPPPRCFSFHIRYPVL
ncbi:uncharacterized protein LOC133314915 [Gastrolobium bilobum]|uniref:uncharacterized protein LOC133314915 n=1 Tax=Gastrolobium bilobum TaxID=150636 RepID=UPI002AB2C815|nr:uncharacterized protein LOC133314915 [Gastrolobium bilobum]